MKRLISYDPSSNDYEDEFDKQWREKFGPDDEPMKFDSLDEFHDWLEEVKQFEPVYNKQI